MCWLHLPNNLKCVGDAVSNSAGITSRWRRSSLSCVSLWIRQDQGVEVEPDPAHVWKINNAGRQKHNCLSVGKAHFQLRVTRI